MKTKFLVLVFGLISILSFGQKDVRTLMYIKGQAVPVDEFLYIYTKNNGAKADFSKASLDENLNLYKNFKLKVQYAKDMKLDTLQSIKTELAGYRKQLADSYLMDKEVTEKLIHEAYERSKKDLHLSHILISVPSSTPNDTTLAFKRITELKDKLNKGADFTSLAKEFSDDKTTKENGGELGYFTSIFPNGFYNVETAVYKLKAGQITDPIRSSLGYHLFKVDDIRDARGEIEVSHILIRTKKDDKSSEAIAKAKIDSIYQLLTRGENFEDMAEQYSQDKGSSLKGGYIGFFGINRYEKSFEDAAFGLKKDGAFSAPIETSAGWHIIKRISARPIGDYENARKRIEPKVKTDSRFDEAREVLLQKIKKECGLKEDPKLMQAYISSLNDTYFNNDWLPPGQNADKVLFSMDSGTKLTLGEFELDLKSNTRKRMSMKQTHTVETAVKDMYNDALNTALLKYEEGKLEVKYPDFKSLMREYEEGTLLFAASEKMVWKKASEDSTGLKKYFDTNLKGRYKWDRRAVTSIVTLRQGTEEDAKKIAVYFKTHTAAEVETHFNTDKKVVMVEDKSFEQDKNQDVDKLLWKKDEISGVLKDPKTKAFYIVKINEVLAPADKTLEESRGYAVAEYGDYLEKQWIASLQKDIPVKIDTKVYESLIKK